MSQNRGAASESINALPIYKFKTKKNKRNGDSNSAAAEGGVVAAGTEKEHVISGEDAVSTIRSLDINSAYFIKTLDSKLHFPLRNA